MKGITGGLRALRAGEVPQYTEVVDQARHTALERLIAHAQSLGGNSVLGVGFDSSEPGESLPKSLRTERLRSSHRPDPDRLRGGGPQSGGWVSQAERRSSRKGS